MRRIIMWSLSVMLTLLVSPAFAQDETQPWPTNGWQTSTPEAQGMNSETLTAMLDSIVAQNVPIHSVLVIRNGYMVLEAYNYPYAPDDLHTVYSVTKSITSALFGIAVDQGFIEGGEQKMLDFFPDYTPANLDEAKQSITLDNLLTMSPGFDWPGGMGEPLLGDMMVTDDWIQYMLDRPMRGEPGQLFVYNSGVSNMLAAIIAQASGQNLLHFAQTNLFDPLGIDAVEWAADPQGRNLGGFGLQLTPRDMAKIGYLYLNKGQWGGQEIISSGWVGYSTQQRISARPLSDGYGYHWWTNIQGYYMAIGYGGQYIIVHPEQNLVVVFTSNLSASAGSQPETYLKNFILPAIEGNKALPDNPEGVAALETAVVSFAEPVAEEMPPLPETAEQISGQEYQFSENDFGWETMSLTFEEAANTAQLILDGEQPLMIGLDEVAQVNDMADAEAIFAIGFDDILRVDPVAGAEPMLVTGNWTKENRFVIHIELQGTVNWYQLTLTFNEQDVQVTVRNGLSGSSYSLEGSAA